MLPYQWHGGLGYQADVKKGVFEKKYAYTVDGSQELLCQI